METKLDLALKSFSEKEVLPNYRRRSIASAGLGTAGATALAFAISAILKKDPALAKVGLIAAPATGLLAGINEASNLDTDQVTLDWKGRENIDKGMTYLNLSHQVFKPNVYALDKYLPKDKVNKLNEDYRKSLEKYPLDKSKKKTPEYKANDYKRDDLKYKLMEDKVDLFLDNQRLGKSRLYR